MRLTENTIGALILRVTTQMPISVRLSRTRAMPNDHVPTEWLAEYSRGILLEPRLAQVEEHILICELCRQRLSQFDDHWGLNG